MKTREISPAEASDLCSRDEGHFFDRKALGIAGNKIQKVAVAFGNADGGEFVIGIADSKEQPDPDRRWQGAAAVEDYNPALQVLFDVNPSLDLRTEILSCEAEPGLVLRVIVEKGAEVHKTADNTVYVRRGASSLPVKDPQRILELSFAKGATTYEDHILPTLPLESITESDEIKEFLAGYSPRTDPLEYVVNQNLADFRTWDPRVAAALLFHSNPAAVLPKKCSVKIARYATREDEPERDHLQFADTLSGPLYPLIGQAIERIAEIVSSVEVWTTEGRKSIEYPREAIWEVFVNALIHRDYSISDDVVVYIYDNRIEIVSPGRLPGYVTVDNILDARYSRNPKIIRSLNWYKNPPNKDLGEGLNTAFQKMKEWRLRDPEIIEDGNYVRVVLPHAPLAEPARLIMDFLRVHPMIRNAEARDLTGIRSENKVKGEFYRLRDEGLIERVPGLEGNKAAWRLTDLGRARLGDAA